MGGCIREDELLGGGREGHLGREDEVVAPIEHLAIGLLGRLAAEGRVSDQHFEHYDAQGPPVARLRVPVLLEHLGRDVVWRKIGAYPYTTHP